MHGIVPVEPGFVRRQMSAVLRDIGADCIKTGMLLDAGIVEAVADALDADAPGVPLVVDPVMVASSGARLLAEAGVLALKRRLIPRATVLTPNVPEAEALAGCAIASLADMRLAAARLLELGAKCVVVTGGHLPGEVLYDLALDARQSFVLEARRIATRSHARHRLHLRLGHRRGLGAGPRLSPGGRARARLCARGDPRPRRASGAGTVRSTTPTPSFGKS